MTARPSVPAATPTRIPGFVERSRSLVTRLLRLGLPMGPNVLMTVVGRKSGLPRTVPVAILKADGREVVFAAFGQRAWVHNLRAAGTATIQRGRRRRTVRAVELDPETAARVLAAGIPSVVRVPIVGPMIAGWYGLDRSSTAADYAESAHLHPAFELHDVDPSDD
jgi:deazaflavin-dependent oxidoreductase (nitroreductase family)